MSVFSGISGVKTVKVCLHFCISLGYADSGETPDIAELCTIIILTESFVLVRIFVNSYGVVIEVGGDAVVEIADAVAPAD